jgi:hypothetical protein
MFFSVELYSTESTFETFRGRHDWSGFVSKNKTIRFKLE